MKRKKRQRKSGMFWAKSSSKPLSLALAIATSPQRRLLADVFSAERSSTLLAAGGEAATLWHAQSRDRHQEPSGVSFCGRLIQDGGPVDREAERLEQLLVSPASPLASPSFFDVPRALKGNRAIALNVNSSHYIRMSRRFKKGQQLLWLGLCIRNSSRSHGR